MKKQVKASPGDYISIMTTKESTEGTLLESHEPDIFLIKLKSGYNIGIKKEIKDKYLFLPGIFFWLFKLLFWVYLISVGVGLFNLLPLGPVDGGRMFYVAALYITKDKLKAKKIYTYVTLLCLTLIFINLLPYIIKLISFILIPLILLF